jgi:tetratricopeptide (TPR) repeat protein
MKEMTEQVTIWSSYENLLSEAEKKFFDQEFDEALKLWKEYTRITGSPNWHVITRDLHQIIMEFLSAQISDSQQYFEEWLRLRNKMNRSELSVYAFQLMERHLAQLFLKNKQTVSFDLATGVFCYIEKRYDKAKENLSVVLNQQPDNLLARIFLSKCCYALDQVDLGTGYLSQALFLGGNEILPDDVGSEHIRNLYGRLKSLHGRGEAGVWLVPFEAWYRNWLVWIEDITFFQVMQHKERSERILQVKYYASEKYRHFIRCLFIEEYVRQFIPKEKGIIWEQEAYMQKLDETLFKRYRKRRQPVA